MLYVPCHTCIILFLQEINDYHPTIKFMHRRDINGSQLTDMLALSHLTRFWSQNLCGLSSASSKLPIHEVGKQTVTNITRVLQLPGVCVGYGYLLILASAGTQQTTRCIVVTYSHESTENIESVDRQNTQQCVCWHKSTHNMHVTFPQYLWVKVQWTGLNI